LNARTQQLSCEARLWPVLEGLGTRPPRKFVEFREQSVPAFEKSSSRGAWHLYSVVGTGAAPGGQVGGVGNLASVERQAAAAYASRQALPEALEFGSE